MLLTTLSTVAAIVAILAGFVAVRTADALARDRHRMTSMRSDIFGLHAEIEKLSARHIKLQGLFYALRAELRNGGPIDPPQAQRMTQSVEACPNWSTAQLEGPTSRAAACECDYCVGMRILRHNTRAQLVPKSHQERLGAIKAGLTTNE